MEQQSVSQHLSIPVVTVCLRIGNFISRRSAHTVSRPADRAQSAGNQRPEIDGGVEMIDLVIIAVIVAPAIPIIILRGVRTTEMIDTVRLPTLRIDLRPFHHGIAAKGSICDLRSRTVDLLSVVVRIEVMVYDAGIGQHTGTRHKLFARIKRPTAIVELTGAEIHSRRGKRCIVHIRRISYSSGRAGSRLDQVVAKQIISLLGSYAGSVRFAAVIGAGTRVRECRVVIDYADRYIGICVSTVRSDVLEQFTLSLAGRITSRAPSNNCTGNTVRQLCRDFNLNGVRCRNIYRLSGKLLHRFRFIHDYTVSLVPVIHALRGIRERCIVVSSGGGSATVSKDSRRLDVGDQIAVELILRIIGCLPPDNCTFHGAECLVIHDRIVGKCCCDFHNATLNSHAECQHIGRLNAAEEVSVFTENQIFFCHFDYSPFALRISYNGADKLAIRVKSLDGSRHFCPCCALQHICHG